MNELNKISRIIDRELPGADRETLLVIDARQVRTALSRQRNSRRPPVLPALC
jgi:fused signal recognition particle receptor